MYFYNARYYDASLGRFVQADSMVPEPGNPQSLNRYSYVLNSPLKYVDPTGYFTEDAIIEYLKGVYGDQQTEDTKELMWQLVLRSWKSHKTLWNMLSEAEAGNMLMYTDNNEQVCFGRFLGEGKSKLSGIEGIPLPDLEEVSGAGDMGLTGVLQNDIVGLFSYDHAHLKLKYPGVSPGTWDSVGVREVTAFENALFRTMVTAPLALIPAGGTLALAKHLGIGGTGWILGGLIASNLPELKPGNDTVSASNALGHSLIVTLDRGVVASSSVSRWEWPIIDAPLP